MLINRLPFRAALQWKWGLILARVPRIVFSLPDAETDAWNAVATLQRLVSVSFFISLFKNLSVGVNTRLVGSKQLCRPSILLLVAFCRAIDRKESSVLSCFPLKDSGRNRWVIHFTLEDTWQEQSWGRLWPAKGRRVFSYLIEASFQLVHCYTLSCETFVLASCACCCCHRLRPSRICGPSNPARMGL